jgi:rRNA-processing protein FCF1
VRFSPHGVIADDVIRDLVEAEPTGRPVVVVTTDRELATSVTKKGARAVASMALVRAMGC